MAEQWATMVYEVILEETLVRYIICHDSDVELVFKVTVLPIGVDAQVLSVREVRTVSVPFSAFIMLPRWMSRSPSLGCDIVLWIHPF